jgi:hypothetical protein
VPEVVPPVRLDPMHAGCYAGLSDSICKPQIRLICASQLIREIPGEPARHPRLPTRSRGLPIEQ